MRRKRGMPGARNPGRATAVRWFAGVAALAAVVLAGLHLYRADERGQSTAPKPQPCAEESVRCHLLSTGVWTVIYTPPGEEGAPVIRTSGERGGLVLWDPGRPGLRPLDAVSARSLLPSWLRHRAVATFIEPWAVHGVSAECLETVTDVSTGGELSEWQTKNWSDDFRNSCDMDLYSLDRAEYQESFKELVEKEGEISGVYAQSFGAVRATAVMPELERAGGWVVMDAPAPPPGTSATTLMVERSLAVEAGLQDVMECDESDAASDCRKELHRTLRDMGYDGTQTGLADGAEEYERMTALFSLSRDLGKNAEPLREILISWPDIGKAGKGVVESSSRSYTRRDRDGQVLPEFVGYLANVCTAYRGWGVGAGSPERNPLGAALSGMHRPCSVMPAGADSTWTMPDKKETPRLLLLVNPLDPVNPPHAAEAWAEKYPDADRLDYRYPGHTKAPEELDGEVSAWGTGSVG
ncbi:alpha/beta hydrolase [Streptomyces pini]|uniref:TAP-like protein n=1 Tax=Streptomyces pini TaxID=1520580 RepID=A0A1I4G259_9ACTN|nr:alpha/beta hydrolase [Streptomyces pini]SFL23307.1 TAP-like protein [Streptomyces pini]